MKCIRAPRCPLRLRSADPAVRALLERESRSIAALVKTDGDPVVEAPGKRPLGYVLSVAANVEVLVGLKGLVEAAKESERIERTLKKIEKDAASLDKRLADSKFMSNAPPEVVVQAREQRGSSSTSARGSSKSAASWTNSRSERLGRHLMSASQGSRDPSRSRPPERTDRRAGCPSRGTPRCPICRPTSSASRRPAVSSDSSRCTRRTRSAHCACVSSAPSGVVRSQPTTSTAPATALHMDLAS